jgi:FdhD protein
MEIRVEVRQGGASAEVPVAVTMRTPGDDFDLAAGFLLTEGILGHPGDIEDVRYCRNVRPQEYNVVTVRAATPEGFKAEALTRNFYVSSSCGVCGKASLEAVEALGCAPVADLGFRIAVDVLASLPEGLREAQSVFERTGGLHAAGLFDPSGALLCVREDVGRHNAVDKVIGSRALSHGLPASQVGLVVSGRTSFEILQKAAVAGIPMVVAVGAPSSLAVSTARRFNISLTGFTSGDGFNVYAGEERIVGAPEIE